MRSIVVALGVSHTSLDAVDSESHCKRSDGAMPSRISLGPTSWPLASQYPAQAAVGATSRAFGAGLAGAGDRRKRGVTGVDQLLQAVRGALRQIALAVTAGKVAALRRIEPDQAVGPAISAHGVAVDNADVGRRIRRRLQGG